MEKFTTHTETKLLIGEESFVGGGIVVLLSKRESFSNKGMQRNYQTLMDFPVGHKPFIF
jgi:hypothetical protein